MDYAQYYLDLKTANKEVSSESDMSDPHTIIKQKSDIYSKSHRFDEVIMQPKDGFENGRFTLIIQLMMFVAKKSI